MNANETELSHDPADVAGYLEKSLWFGLFLVAISVVSGSFFG